MKIDNSEYRLAFKCVTSNYESCFISHGSLYKLSKQYLPGAIVRGYKNFPLYTTVGVSIYDTDLRAFASYNKVMLVKFRLKDVVMNQPAFRLYSTGLICASDASSADMMRIIRKNCKRHLEHDFHGVLVKRLEVIEEVNMENFKCSADALIACENKFGIPRFSISMYK